MKDGTRVLAALVAAIGIGVVLAAIGNSRAIGVADALAPIGTLWVNAIRMTVIPLIVSLIITGIASAADVGTIGRMGARTLLVFFLLLVGTAYAVIRVAGRVYARTLLHRGSRVRWKQALRLSSS